MLEIGIEASRSCLKSRQLQVALFHPLLRLGKLSSALWLQRVLGFLTPPRTLPGSSSLLLMVTRMCGVYTGSAWPHRSCPQTRQLHEYELTSTEKLDTQMLGQPFGRRWIAGIAVSVYCFMGGLALLFIYPARSRHCSHDEQRSSRISFGEKDPSLKARY